MQKLYLEHIDRQTDRHTHIHNENITSTAYAGGKNITNVKLKITQIQFY